MANHHRKTMSRGSLFSVAVFLLTITISFLSSDQTYALTLTPVIDALAPVLGVVHHVDTTPGAQHDDNTAKSAAAAAKKSSQSAPAPAASQSPAVDTTTAQPLSQLPTIDALDTSQMASWRASSPIGTAMTTSAVLEAQTIPSTTPLQATDRGWELFGVGWYWWLVGGVVSYGLVRQIVFMRHRLALNEHTIAS